VSRRGKVGVVSLALLPVEVVMEGDSSSHFSPVSWQQGVLVGIFQRYLQLIPVFQKA